MTATIGAVKNAGNIDDLSKIIDCLDDFGDVSIVLREAGIDRAFAQSALEASKFANELDDVVDSSTGLKKIDTALDGLDDGADFVDNLGDAFKGAGQKIGSFLKTAGPMLLFAAAVAGTAIAIKNYYEKFDKLVEAAETSQNAYSDTATEIKNLQSEIDSTTAKIKELEAQGELTITEQGELERLRNQNFELERQKKLKEEIAEQQSKQATNDAMEALTLERTQDLTQKNRTSGSSRHDFVDQTEYKQTNVVTATKNEIAALEELKEKRNALLNDDIDDLEQTELFNSLDSEISKYETEISSNLESLAALRNNFIDQSTGLLKDNLTKEQEDLFYTINQAIDDFNNIDLTGTEKEIAKLDSFFNGSANGNFMKERLQEATNEGENLNNVLAGMGLTLSDLGIESIDTLSSYFTKTAEEAEEAKKTVQDYATTVADVVAAGETVNQDDSWQKMSEAYKTAKDLLKEGKTGIDDFQSVAALLNPEKVKELAEKGGKYTADAYEEAFREVKKIADRWFSEDETKSMEYFVNDFKKAGLFDVTTDSKGLWDIETKFKSTAEAAKEFGISVEAVETMLQGLQAYGYEFDEVLFSGDALDRYQENLTKIKALYESMGEGSSKDALGEMIGNWDSELEKYKEDLDSLSEPQIVQIEFQYDIAQIEAELEKLRNRKAAGEKFGRKEYADWINTYDAKYSSQKEGFGLDEVEIKAVTISDDAVEKAREELAKAVDSGNENWIVEAQVKLIAAQESRDALLEAFNKWNSEQEIPITADSGVAEVEAAWEEFTSAPQVVKIEGEVTNTESIRATLESLAVGSTITYEAKMSDGSIAMITAMMDADGNITYTANIGDAIETVDEKKNRDGTVYYEANMDKAEKAEPPVLSGTAKYNADFGNLKNKRAPKIYGTAEYTTTYKGAILSRHSGTMLSPAHKDGTAYNVLNTLPAYSNGRVGLDKDQRALVNELGEKYAETKSI